MFLILLSLLSPAHAERLPFPDDELVRVQSATRAEAIREQAIQTSVRRMHWILRPFARARLRAVATLCPAYHLVVRDPDFEVRCDGETVFSWSLGRTGTWTTETGDTVHVTLIQQPRAFTLRFQGDGGAKTFHYEVVGAGELRVTQTIDSPRLPVPVTYALDYGRP